MHMREIPFKEAWGRMRAGEVLLVKGACMVFWVKLHGSELRVSSRSNPIDCESGYIPCGLDEFTFFDPASAEILSVSRPGIGVWEWFVDSSGKCPADILDEVHRDTPEGTVRRWRLVDEG